MYNNKYLSHTSNVISPRINEVAWKEGAKACRHFETVRVSSNSLNDTREERWKEETQRNQAEFIRFDLSPSARPLSIHAYRARLLLPSINPYILK